MCPEVTQNEPILFNISSAEGEYAERSGRAGEAQSSKTVMTSAKGGVLRLPSSDGDLLFIELDKDDTMWVFSFYVEGSRANRAALIRG